MRPSVPNAHLLLLGAALFAACSSSPSNTSVASDASDVANDLALIPDTPEVATFGDADEDSDTSTSPTPDASDASGAGGEPCTDNSDCASDLCLQLGDGEGGFCSDGCATDADCPDGFECLTFTDSGTDAVQRCVPSDLCIDADNDGYGVGPGCAGRDCNDDDDTVNPAADEVCDGIDQDCDGRTDENPSDERRPCDTGFAGRCADGTTLCRDALLFCEPVATLGEEVCDNADNDCNGAVDDAGACAGEPCCYNDICEGVCAGALLDETNACAQPAGFGEEICDGLDNNCDGQIDEGVELTYYLDDDEDTFGDPETSVQACVAPADYVANADDCDDSSDLALPGGTEVCDDLDNDCNAEVDEGVCAGLPCCWADTCEGICATAVTDDSGTCAEPAGFGDETCDEIDNDCDGETDETFDIGNLCSAGDGACEVLGTTICTAEGTGIECDAIAGDSTAEVCDGVDNDCDGETDEDFALGVACSNGTGACSATGVQVCSDDLAGVVCDGVAGASAPEVCDNIDNDCDGSTDEDFALGLACSNGVGACTASGVQVCSDDLAGVVCDAVAGASAPEVCDNIDNDCDGSTDEGNPGGGDACTTGQSGVCSSGVRTCAAGELVCERVTESTDEVCDTVDNDCDGATDEGFNTGGPCSVGVGGCARNGVWVCNGAGNGRVCSVTAGTAAPELCDGVDNDCDGTIDDGNPGGGGSCSTGVPGICAAGTRTCSGGVLECQPNNAPAGEVCDTVDNDCDGATDEGFNTGGPCSVGVGGCARNGVWVCNGAGNGRVCSVTAGTAAPEVCDGVDNDCNGSIDDGNPGGGGSCSTGLFGICQAGTRACSGGELVCQRNNSPTAESCDGVDNNCNGSTDEGNPGGGAACATGLSGVCAAGTRTCSGGNLLCQANTSPTAEVCDGADNNCNGSIDEGNPGGGGACSRGLGECRVTGVFVCGGSNGIQCLAPVGPDPVPELCDGRDNDCDGSIDENFADLRNSCSAGVGACLRTGSRVCNGAQNGTTCSVSAGSPSAEICGNGIDEDCNGSDLACPSPCQSVTRTRVWVDESTGAYTSGFVSQIGDLFAGGGRTVTRGQFLFGSGLANYDVILVDSDSLSGSVSPTEINAWIQAGGALYLANENPSATQCNYLNSLVSSSGLSFSCDSNDVNSSAIDSKFNLLSGVSGNLVNSGGYLEVLGGGNANRLAGRDSSNMAGRYAQVGCGSVILWGDVQYGDTGVYTGNTPQVWGLFRDFLLDVP